MAAEFSLEAKLALLTDPANFPDQPARVEVIETHMAWVFLTEKYAYKLKKPVACSYLDFSTVTSRKFFCQEEVRLNRRLAPDVYLKVITLNQDHGRLRLDGEGEVVDWLVLMRRLPRLRMLDSLLRRRNLERRHLYRLAEVIAAFHRNCQSQPVSGETYRSHYRHAVLLNGQWLQRLRWLCQGIEAQFLIERQLNFIERRSHWFDSRAGEGLLVEGHGDLRPGHVCFESETPVVIDCLEFNRNLRILDQGDETAYLAMECAWLGYEEAGLTFLRHYQGLLGDELPPPLRAFYMAYRATLRGRLLLARVLETAPQKRFLWQRRGRRYLRLAAGYCGQLGV